MAAQRAHDRQRRPAFYAELATCGNGDLAAGAFHAPTLVFRAGRRITEIAAALAGSAVGLFGSREPDAAASLAGRDDDPRLGSRRAVSVMFVDTRPRRSHLGHGSRVVQAATIVSRSDAMIWLHRPNRESKLMPSARILIVLVTPFQQNCTLLWCETTKHAVVIDPGGDLPMIEQAIARVGVMVTQIWLTHGHIDHAGGAAALKERLGVPIEGPHRGDLFLLESLADTGRGLGIGDTHDVIPDRWLDEGDQVAVGELVFKVLHVPGHSPGSVAFFNAAQRFAVVGDALFQGSIGRTDLPGGDHAQLIASIKDKLLPLGDDVAFICGHGPGSTIALERVSNPFLR
jgi:hydroxyacylglutathione hydrolase